MIAGFCHLCLEMLNGLNGLLYSADHHVEGMLLRTLMLSLKAMSEVDVLVVVYNKPVPKHLLYSLYIITIEHESL